MNVRSMVGTVQRRGVGVVSTMAVIAVFTLSWNAGDCAPATQDEWPQLQQNAQRHGRVEVEVPPPYRARWIWFGPEQILRSRESKRAAGWDADLSSAEGKNYPMPNSLPFCFAGSMQPIRVAGRVFVGDCQGKVYALRSDDGQTLWTADNPGG